MNVLNADINTNKNMRIRPTVISLFAGCGGSSLGYKNAGYKELLAIDFDKNSVDTFKLNFPGVPVWQRDILEIKGTEILKFCKIKKGELDILDGSPPCQGFSTAGRRNITDSRNDLFLENIRIIEELYPRVFLIENVSGMAKGKMKGRFIEFLKILKLLNYNVKCKLMNAKYYGVPQSRERVIFIGVRKDLKIKPSYPKPNIKLIPVREAFKNCPDGLSYSINPKSKLLEWLKLMGQGMSLQDAGCKFGFDASRLDNSKPAPTVKKALGSYAIGVIHPTEDRRITISELKRLASFPDDFKFVGKFSEQWARIGNAVMPKFMEAIALHIKKNIFDKIKKKK